MLEVLSLVNITMANTINKDINGFEAMNAMGNLLEINNIMQLDIRDTR